MYYLFDKNGNTSTFCLDEQRLFDMFAIENDAGGKTLPDGYSIKEYDGCISPDVLYLDDAGEVKERVFKVDKAEEATREKARALKELDAQYDTDKAELSKYYVEAALSGNTDAQTDIKTELDALTSEYDKKRAEIEEG